MVDLTCRRVVGEIIMFLGGLSLNLYVDFY